VDGSQAASVIAGVVNCSGGRAGVFCDEYALTVFLRGPSGSTAENKLMGRKAWSLVGLEHGVAPAVTCGQGQVRVENVLGVVNILKLRIRRTCSRAGDFIGSIHFSAVIHRHKSAVGVTEIVGNTKGDRF
jgi:hypothetical protein